MVIEGYNVAEGGNNCSCIYYNLGAAAINCFAIETGLGCGCGLVISRKNYVAFVIISIYTDILSNLYRNVTTAPCGALGLSFCLTGCSNSSRGFYLLPV